MYGKYVIFSIDAEADAAAYNRFYNTVLHHKLRKNNIIPVVGSWMGVSERAFIMEGNDFHNCVENKLIENQEAVLWVSSCNKQYCTLQFKDGSHKFVGCMKHVTKEEAFAAGDWTYVPQVDRYFTIVQGNPDRVPDDQPTEH